MILTLRTDITGNNIKLTSLSVEHTLQPLLRELRHIILSKSGIGELAYILSTYTVGRPGWKLCYTRPDAKLLHQALRPQVDTNYALALGHGLGGY